LSNSHATPSAGGAVGDGPRLARLALLPAVLAVSTAAIFVRVADAAPLATAFWRGAIAGLAFLPLLILPPLRAQFQGLSWLFIGKIAAATSIIACHQIAFITSLKYTSVAAATFLTCSVPVFTAFLGWMILGERVSLRSLGAIGGALVGMALISLSDVGETAFKGNLLALLAAVLASLYSVFARRLRQSVPLVPFMFTVHISGTLFLFVISAVFGVGLLNFSRASWTGLILLGLIPTLIGHSLLTYSIGHLRAFVVNAAILGEPVGATILAALLIGEIPTLLTMVGGIIVMICILLIVLETTTLPEPEST
jgi:drug/metabolite transporter (DMT)-like permease